ncbi:MAG: hypothetical protein ACR2HG_14035 [Pyrinomonadaceae bacterium]
MAQNKNETDRELAGLRGAVKKVENYLIDYSQPDDTIIEKERQWFTNSYTPSGNYSETISYQPDEISIVNVYIYDAEGKNVECRDYSSTADKSLDKYQKYVQKFDERGNLIERIVTESDGSSSVRFVYKYDAKGNKIEYKYYNYTGDLGGKIIYAYNDDGKLLSQIYSGGDGSLIWKHLYVVNGKGQTIEDSTYLGETLRYKILFTYDNKGRVIREDTTEFNAIPNTWTSHSPEPGTVLFFYDGKGKKKEEIKFNINGFVKNAALYSYDEKENEIEGSWFESGGSFDDIMKVKDKSLAAQRKFLGIFKGKITSQYEYDARGNWTKKTRFNYVQEDGKPIVQSGERRIISYY